MHARRRVLSDARIQCAMPSEVLAQLEALAAADALTLSAEARRLLARAVACEYAALLNERSANVGTAVVAG